MLIHAIMATLGFLFIIFAVVWANGVKKGLTINKEPNPLMSLIVYIGCLVFAGYFLVSALYLWIYRTFWKNYTDSSYA